MTPIEKSLTRLCPSIKNGADQQLTVTIQPSAQGGELLLHWVNDKKKAGDRVFQFTDLCQPDKGHPSEWGTWIKTEELKSQIQIAPGLGQGQKAEMLLFIDRILIGRQWMASESSLEWNDYLISRGRQDLLDMESLKEREGLRKQREKVEQDEIERNQRSAALRKAPSFTRPEPPPPPPAKKAAKRKAPTRA